MNQPGHLTYAEISSQGEAIEQVARQESEIRAWVERYLAKGQYEEIIFIGSGSSYYQAITMAATCRKWLGAYASAMPSSDLLLFGETWMPADRRTLIVGVSRSGESSEVVLALQAFKDKPNRTICGITCYADSTMGRLCDCLVSPLGQEASTVMTRSLSSMIYLMQRAIAAVGGSDRELPAVAERIEAVVKASDSLADELTNKSYNKVIYLGMGGYYGLAQEGCLKLKEMANIWTESFGTLEFRHGPKSIVDGETLIVILLSEEARGYELKVAQEMQAYGASVVLVTRKGGADTSFADGVLEVGGPADDDARAVLYLPLMQYIGYYTAMKRGLDPDHPRNLTQVVKL